MSPRSSDRGHRVSHEPNPDPPSQETEFLLVNAGVASIIISVEDLSVLPRTSLEHCYIVSTGHGTSGPFVFSGVAITEFIHRMIPDLTDWTLIEVIGADGFGTSFKLDELAESDNSRHPILADSIDGQPMTRNQGLVRLIVPNEKDDALRQVKWVAQIRVH